MVPLSLADELSFTLAPDEACGTIELVCSDPTLPTNQGNLAYRAAALFRDRLVNHVFPAVRIALTKQIPHGAGLGGGSSDAATVLLALNELHSAPFSTAELAGLAAELGSDIPFFVYRSAAICRGRGEQVQPCAFSTSLPLLLLKPAFSIPTPWAYKQWQNSREIGETHYEAQVFEWGTLVNDLERPVYEKYFALAEMKNWLLAEPGVAGALLSGSGSTMIALLDDIHMGDELSKRARNRFGPMWTHVCTTLAT